ncbi:DUF255 domain-containing protein [Candidatus Woesearchaeota archaeon]|nr:DUF255 domain-containing protein [Candidatus Woesearchaeota archaeon]HIH55461.1 DUF255 domain-containing protein [Candidatus Woesearchaeota archaeon]HIJ01897.1 DUF255 domain-containing protein [Candidatus Woesearchaeota archaeon]HIJ13776.1 DUF255 domain-containing protein [Candidatus Woesearchaeota archaeon]
MIPAVFAVERYSYENAEKLKPLINWREYNANAFQEAANDNKPVFLLLTAPSWCYWCQVYESEDYLFNADVVNYINKNFIPVYVDADKRQDLTRQYLEGGWPSTTILSPQGKRIAGFSGPRPPNVMLSTMQQALDSVKNNITSAKHTYNYVPLPEHILTVGELKQLIDSYIAYNIQMYDPIYGSFGSGQKFPQPRTSDFFLDTYEKAYDKKYLLMIVNTLHNEYTNISELKNNYNLFDPVEGGFHRYGTTRDYTPPHYEKMLYDNARLLKTYYRLYTLSNDSIAQEVTNKTLNMLLSWYDSNGGFASNTDASPEERYYSLIDRPKEKPRLERTKYTDWNSEAIITFLYIWNKTIDKKYYDIAKDTLDFYKINMLTNNDGVYHYITPSGEKGITGSLTDNAYMLLAFTDAAQYDNNYLYNAEQIANYTLDNLYDWNSSGFFERHSNDIESYAPGENILLNKPSEENGIMVYAYIRLYELTKEPLYLDVAVRTLGTLSNNIGGLDRGYYYIKASEEILEKNYLKDFNKNKPVMDKLYDTRRKDFWLNNVLNGTETFNSLMIIMMIIAFIAGLISFISPCTLPILPAYIGYALKTSKKNIFIMSVSFFIGLSLVFSLLGMTSTILGGFLKQNIPLFTQIAGALIILLGIYILTGIGFSGFNVYANKSKTIIGGLLTGATLGIAWTPCIGPILVSILILASTVGNFLSGGLLLFMYSIGLSIPLILASLYMKRHDDSKLWNILKGKMIKTKVWKKDIEIHSTTLISGILFILLGMAILTGTITYLNRYVAYAPIQKTMFKIEEFLLLFLK